ncbi:MAG: PrsW family glutamic-type intramembrane protease [Treponema sp.]|nr:PrsW family glutamic-type intramembrane protease [Treponema sp.]
MSGSWIILLIILVSSIPVIAVYFWFRIAKYQFSIVWFLFALLAGAAAFIPALILQDILTFSSVTQGRMALLYEFFIRIAFTEEISRLLMLIIFYFVAGFFSKQNVDKTGDGLPEVTTFNSVKKGMATGLIAGLGFALLESARYASSSVDPGILLLRIFFTFPLHAACGSRVGAAAVLFRAFPIQAILRIITATAIHGVYNFLLELPFGISAIAAFLIAVSAFFTAIISIKGGWNDNPALDKNDEN